MSCGLADVCQLLLAVALLASVVFYVVGYLEARRFFGRRARVRAQAGDAKRLPRVTLLKPLQGADADLYRSLSTFCGQDYPTFQIVFGVAAGADPAVQVVRRLQAEFPSVDIELVIDPRVHGANLKVSNLHNMYRAAKYEIILIADSDIRVTRDYLRRIVSEFADPRVGLATCLYRAVPTGGLPAVVETLCVNTDFVPMVMVARVAEKPSYAFGSTIAIRRAVLDASGGFLPLANYLADDYHLGNRIAACGQRLALSDLVVDTVTNVKTWRGLLAHQVRWAATSPAW
jgi:ceramide glucosyltransferase